MWSQASGGIANGFIGTTVTNTGAALTNPSNKASNVGPGVGLRYQF